MEGKNKETSGFNLEAMEKKYGKIKVIVVGRKTEMQANPENLSEEIEVETEAGKTVYLRPLDRATMKYALSKQVRADGSVDTISPGEAVLSKCTLEGSDPEVKTNNKFFFPACIEAYAWLQEEAGLF